MKTFNVTVTRDTTESIQLTIRAKNTAHAEMQAEELSKASTAWEKDDGNLWQPYVTHCELQP